MVARQRAGPGCWVLLPRAHPRRPSFIWRSARTRARGRRRGAAGSRSAGSAALQSRSWDGTSRRKSGSGEPRSRQTNERRLARFHALDAESCRRSRIGDPEDPLPALRAASCGQSLAVYPGKVQVGSIRRQLDALCRSRRLHHFPPGQAQWRWRRARSMQRQLQAGGHGRDRDELPVHDHVAGNILPVGLPRPP